MIVDTVNFIACVWFVKQHLLRDCELMALPAIAVVAFVGDHIQDKHSWWLANRFVCSLKMRKNQMRTEKLTHCFTTGSPHWLQPCWVYAGSTIPDRSTGRSQMNAVPAPPGRGVSHGLPHPIKKSEFRKHWPTKTTVLIWLATVPQWWGVWRFPAKPTREQGSRHTFRRQRNRVRWRTFANTLGPLEEQRA